MCVIHCRNGCTDMLYYCVIFVILNLKKKKKKKKDERRGRGDYTPHKDKKNNKKNPSVSRRVVGVRLYRANIDTIHAEQKIETPYRRWCSSLVVSQVKMTF